MGIKKSHSGYSASFDANDKKENLAIISDIRKKVQYKSGSFKLPPSRKISLSHLRRESNPENQYKEVKRPSTKEDLENNFRLSQNSDHEELKSQLTAGDMIRTPGQSQNGKRINSDQAYGLSKTNESFKKGKWVSASKTQDSTIGYTSSTGNTTDYGKGFGEAQLRSSKYSPQ